MQSDEIASVRLAAIAALEALHDKVPPYPAGHVMGRDEERRGTRTATLPGNAPPKKSHLHSRGVA